MSSRSSANLLPMRARIQALRWRTPSRVATRLCLLAALGLAGCASKPTMEVQYAQVTGVGPLGIGVNVVVKVHNSNSFDIMVRQVRAKTVIADQFMLPEVQASPNVWLPAGRSTLVSTPVVIPWTLVPGILATSLGNEYVAYHVQGSADVSATRMLGVQVNNEPLDERGQIPRTMFLSAARTAIPGAR